MILAGALVSAVALSRVCSAEAISVKESKGGAEVTIGGRPFAGYLIKSGHQPVIWPIIGPNGQPMTRQYPLGPRLPGEKGDHPHHRSLWFGHGLVNGLDFWMPPGSGGPAGKHNQIVHREFVALKSGGQVARIVTRNDWTSDATKICEDLRTINFGVDQNGRWIDFAVDILASEADVTFGDTEEGSFAVRVPGTMEVDAKRGGEIVNSQGQKNTDAWGRASEWVDYRGPVDGKPAGIVIFSMPDSFRKPCRWHVRPYGLFAANPFGQRDFPADGGNKQGRIKIKKGDTIRLHFRVLFYAGELSRDEIAAVYKQYALPMAL